MSNQKDLSNIFINNQIPKSQALSIQNTNEEQPIQLKINSVTDYDALTITVVVSVITAFISAMVTIWLVTKSNSSLSKNQSIQQEKMLEQQKQLKIKETKAQNRQEWIDRVRDLFIGYFSDLNHLPIDLQQYVNHKICYEGKEDKYEYVQNFKKIDHKFRSYVVTADLLLSKSNQLDRRIVSCMEEVLNNYNKLISEIEDYAKDKSNKQLDENFFTHNYFGNINFLRDKIRKDIKNLLKAEWERVKKFE